MENVRAIYGDKLTYHPHHYDTLDGAAALVVCTEWPEFREANWKELASHMRGKVIVDANRFLEKPLQGIAGVEHISVGRK